MILVWCHRLAICLTTSLHFPLINMPISKADSRFYNWEVQRSQQTRSQGEMMQQNIKDAFKESFNDTSKHTSNDTLNNTSNDTLNNTSKDTSKDTSYRGKTILFTREKFPVGTSTCNTAKHSERVCWNSKGWVRT